MTYYQFIRRCLLLDAAGMTVIRETIKKVLRSVEKKEAEQEEKRGKAERSD